jgi:hypothetical protein
MDREQYGFRRQRRAAARKSAALLADPLALKISSGMMTGLIYDVISLMRNCEILIVPSSGYSDSFQLRGELYAYCRIYFYPGWNY